MNLAPIALFVYKRPEHTKRTVEALQNNCLASDSELIIFCDGAKSEQDIKQVIAVRNYIATITGFKNITIREHDRNQGLANSVINGVTQVVEQYGKIIVLEDDMVTSPYFLNYMNDALELYKDEKSVISIHGYCYPITEQLPETFFLKGADCWGWATWQRGWALFNPDATELLRQFNSKQQIKEFNFNNSFPFYKMLKHQAMQKIDSWAIRWYASAFLNNRYTLYPGKSLVINIGFDSSATHCHNDNIYDGGYSPNPIKIAKQSVITDVTVYNSIAEFFTNNHSSLKRKIIMWVQHKLKH